MTITHRNARAFPTRKPTISCDSVSCGSAYSLPLSLNVDVGNGADENALRLSATVKTVQMDSFVDE